MRQLHTVGIAHQDLKPSNVLVFKKDGSKLADLGCASDAQVPSRVDEHKIPGDPGYAPIELYYGYSLAGDFDRRFSVDMYLLGSLIFFHFMRISVTQAIQTKLATHSGPNFSGQSFSADLPYIQNAYSMVLKDLRTATEPIAGKLTDSIVNIATELCNPDPALRGDRQNIGTNVSQYNLERYVSRFNLLASKAEKGLL
jgi:serine/threonine protein kinase